MGLIDGHFRRIFPSYEKPPPSKEERLQSREDARAKTKAFLTPEKTEAVRQFARRKVVAAAKRYRAQVGHKRIVAATVDKLRAIQTDGYRRVAKAPAGKA
jgi:hypothetical protein